jgi:hypothetical protein
MRADAQNAMTACLLMALFGHASPATRCLLCGVNRKLESASSTSVFDPRTNIWPDPSLRPTSAIAQRLGAHHIAL